MVNSCSIPEYDAYLEQEAERSQEDRVAVMYLLHERSTGAVASYMSLITDAIKLSTSEKELHNNTRLAPPSLPHWLERSPRLQTAAWPSGFWGGAHGQAGSHSFEKALYQDENFER
jgi:hypothetical protein